MSKIVIFIEGGGQVEREKRVLRLGFDNFFRPLKLLAAARGKSFRLVACGSRDEAYRAFRNERSFEPDTSSFLLVDSEDVMVSDTKVHLSEREHHWELATISIDYLHVMATTMETWIVSDHDAMESFYGRGLVLNSLPRHADMEQVTKPIVSRALAAATRNTGPGEYHKMRHGPKLLGLLDPATVKAKCGCCMRMFVEIEKAIAT